MSAWLLLGFKPGPFRKVGPNAGQFWADHPGSPTEGCSKDCRAMPDLRALR